MRKCRSVLSLVLCLAMLFTVTLPNFATEKNNALSEGTERIIIEETESNESETPETDDITITSKEIIIEDIEDIEIATYSEIIEENDSEDKNYDIEEYSKLDTLSQLTYVEEDVAKIDGDTIVLLKDVELFDTVRFTDNLNLNLAGHTISAPYDNCALFIENSFTLFDDAEEKGNIISRNYKYPVIKIKNAEVNLNGGNIIASNGKDGGDAIYVYNSNITLDGSNVIGGNGEDSIVTKGGDGGNAITIYSSKKNNFVNINSGVLRAGNGGKGIGDQTPDVGIAISYNGIYQGGKFSGRGRNGKKGGGNGGIALNILTGDFKLKNLTYAEWTLFAGSAGMSVNEYNDKAYRLYGDAPSEASESYYSLYDLNGKSYLTSLKDQNPQGLCAIFAFCAQAETYMMREFPEYVKNVFKKKTYSDKATFTKRNEELNLSEFHCAMSLHKPATDAFGNAGHSDALKEADKTRWADDIGSTFQNQLAIASSWRTFIIEDESLSDLTPRNSSVQGYINNKVRQEVLDAYIDKTEVHANNMFIYSAIDYLNDKNEFDRNAWNRDLKEAIVKYSGALVGFYLSGYGFMSNCVINGTNYGSCVIYHANKTLNSYSGHAMYCIGWDDNFNYSYYANGATRSGTGVFILKNSWNDFALLPYNYNWLNWYNTTDYDKVPEMTSEFSPAEFMPSFSKYENNYYYDTGVSGVSKNSRVTQTKAISDSVSVDFSTSYKKALNVFKIRNDKEKAVAVSFYANYFNKQYEVALYKVKNDTNLNDIKNAIANENNKIASKVWTTHHGVNVIDFDAPVDLKKGDYVAVVITGDEDNLGRIWIDGEGVEEIDKGGDFYHTTDFKEKSFFASPTVKINKFYKNNVEVIGDEFDTMSDTYKDDLVNDMGIYKLTDANLRIKLFTNNYVEIDAGDYGNIDGNKIVYYYPTLRATMSTLPTPVVTDSNKVFVGYNTKADGSGKSYNKDSVYHLSIAEYLKLYAQYENKPAPTEPTSSTAPTESTSSTSHTDETTKVQETTKRKTTNGGSPGGGNSGVSRGGTLPNPKIASEEKNVANNYIKISANTNNITVHSLGRSPVHWSTDVNTGKWKLNTSNAFGQTVNANNGFYQLDRTVNINGGQEMLVTDTYYFDANGNMFTGLINTADDKWYYFETEKTSEEGKMVIGWKRIDGNWYYFANNGIMLVNTVTPDGFLIGTDGKMIN